jgi:hypothetical protein
MKELLLNRSNQGSGFHLSGTVTVGYRAEDMTNGQYLYEYGMTKWTQSTAPDDVYIPVLPTSPIGSSSIPSLGVLYSSHTNYNSIKSTTFYLYAEDLSIFENKSVIVTRIDTGLSFTASFLYDAENKQKWMWEIIQPTSFLFFTSSENGKTISISIDMEE